jgi:hypothetical protein
MQRVWCSRLQTNKLKSVLLEPTDGDRLACYAINVCFDETQSPEYTNYAICHILMPT